VVADTGLQRLCSLRWKLRAWLMALSQCERTAAGIFTFPAILMNLSLRIRPATTTALAPILFVFFSAVFSRPYLRSSSVLAPSSSHCCADASACACPNSGVLMSLVPTFAGHRCFVALQHRESSVTRIVRSAGAPATVLSTHTLHAANDILSHTQSALDGYATGSGNPSS
jgi:hypothetical protein